MFRTPLIPIAAALLMLSLAAGAQPAAPAAHPAPAAKPMPTRLVPQPMAATAAAKAAAEHCRDTKGKFVSCDNQAAPKRCRDAQGKFTACPK